MSEEEKSQPQKLTVDFLGKIEKFANVLKGTIEVGDIEKDLIHQSVFNSPP